MKEIVQFCEKAIIKTRWDIKNAESSLKRNASQSQYYAIQTDEGSTRKAIQQRKFKKYNNL